VAWGVFAQDGSWTLNGNVEIGTRLNFDPTPGDNDSTNDKAKVTGNNYHVWDAARGRLVVAYSTFVNDGALVTGFRLNSRGGGDNNPFFSYKGENFNFKTALSGNALLFSDNGGLHRLWGNYQFVNGLVFVEAAYNGEEQEFWYSDRTAGGGPIGSNRGTGDLQNSNLFSRADNASTFTHSDHGNYLLTDLRLEAISFGLRIPNLLAGRYNFYSGSDLKTTAGYEAHQGQGQAGGYELVDGVLKKTVFGVKFAMTPIEFAGQFKVENAGAYIGAKFFAGPLTVGASFSGIFNPEKKDDGTYKEDKFFKVGGDLAFSGGAFDAGLKASMERVTKPDSTGDYVQGLRIQPRFSYKVIPSHLAFALDAGFFFYSLNGVNMTTDGTEKQSDITWAVEPAIYWTFLGTGARSGYGWAPPYIDGGSEGGPTGVIARYRVVSAGADWRLFGKNIEAGQWMPINALDVIFQFHF
jgi:hypothetical protein